MTKKLENKVGSKEHKKFAISFYEGVLGEEKIKDIQHLRNSQIYIQKLIDKYKVYLEEIRKWKIKETQKKRK